MKFGVAVATSVMLLCAAVCTAQASPVEKGKMTFGVLGGGGPGYFAIGGEFGYFVLDGLRPAVSVVYQGQESTSFGQTLTSSEVELTGSLRYYIEIPETPVYPFPEVELGTIFFDYETQGVTNSFQFYRIGVGGGVLAMVSRNFGLEVTLGVDQYTGVDELLTQIGFVPDELEFRYGFGFSVSF